MTIFRNNVDFVLPGLWTSRRRILHKNENDW